MKSFNAYGETLQMTSNEEVNEEVEHPHHYNWHPVAECKEITGYFSYNLGSAIAYLWRHHLKNGRQDLEKAIQHIEFEMERLYSDEHVDRIVPPHEETWDDPSVHEIIPHRSPGSVRDTQGCGRSY